MWGASKALTVYYALSESHLCYAFLVLAQNDNSSGQSTFKGKIPTHGLYLKIPKFLNPMIRLVL